MKERCLNVLKWFFIILGIIFFIQILLAILLFISFSLQTKINFNKAGDFSSSKNNLKQIQPIINYAEDYQAKNNKYPDKIEDSVKVNKKLDYKYENSKNGNCYTITVNSSKDNKTKQYQHCKISSDNSSSSSESYVELSN